MALDPKNKLFSAERAVQQRFGNRFAGPPATAVNTEQVLKAINEVKLLIERAVAPPPETQPAAPADAPELNLLRGQLHDLRSSIDKTKQEIAAVRQPGATDDRLLTAALELDAIVQATEHATHNILSAAEDIDDRVEKLKERVGDVAALEILQEISTLVVKIFENCNFQDITGQRTSKVVKTLNYIEQRVMTMIDIWGAEEFKDIKVAQEKRHGDAALLEGPQFENQGVSQADIDALFG